MRRRFLSVVMCACVVASLVGCDKGTETKDNTGINSSSEGQESEEVVKLDSVSQIEEFAVEYTDTDEIPDWESEHTKIELNDTEVTVDGKGAGFKNKVITITKGGYYVLSGKLSDGKIVIETDAKAKVFLIFDGVEIACSDDAVINEKQADKVVITLVEGTKNILSDGENHADENITAAVYCKDSLTINGEGKLVVNGNNKDAITSKDKLKVIGSNVSIVAVDDGLVGKDLVAVKSGNIQIDSMGDGIKSSETSDVAKGIVCIDGGSISVNSELDAIQAENFVRINGGELKLITGGSSANDSGSQTSDVVQNGEGLAEYKNVVYTDTISTKVNHVIPADATMDLQKPNGEAPTGDMQRPEGMQMPKGEMPTGDMQRPEGMQMPEGEMPTGDMQRPGKEGFEPETDENGEIVQGGNMPGGNRGPGGGKGQGGWGNWGGMNDQNSSNEDMSSSKAIKGGNGVYITDGTINIDSSDDAIHANDMVYILEGTIDISSGDDGIHADTTLDISGGTIKITKSYEGIEAYTINVSGGDVTLVASDDGINAAGGVDGSSTNGRMGQNMFSPGDSGAGVTVSGGSVQLTAYGDGIDSNGSITMTDGTVIVSGPENSGNGSLDYAEEFVMDGGTLLASGPSGMFMSIGQNSKQNVINAYLSGNEGDMIMVMDGDKNIAEFTANTRYSTVIVSVPELEEGKSYTIKYGDKETTAEAEKGQYYRGM